VSVHALLALCNLTMTRGFLLPMGDLQKSKLRLKKGPQDRNIPPFCRSGCGKQVLCGGVSPLRPAVNIFREACSGSSKDKETSLFPWHAQRENASLQQERNAVPCTRSPSIRAKEFSSGESFQNTIRPTKRQSTRKRLFPPGEQSIHLTPGKAWLIMDRGRVDFRKNAGVVHISLLLAVRLCLLQKRKMADAVKWNFLILQRRNPRSRTEVIESTTRISIPLSL
jgi:hypothetical protein